MRTLLRGLMVAGVVLLAGAVQPNAAQAGTFNYSSYSLLNPATVSLRDPALGVDELASAGQITLRGTDGSSLATFCFDIADALQRQGSFTTGGLVTGSIGSAVNALISHVLPALGTNTNASAALQVAIWQVEYGTGRSGVSIGGPADVMALANFYTAEVGNGAWKADPSMQVNLMTAQGNQSQVYMSRVPEPATIGVLAIGAIGALYRRHCRAQGKKLSDQEVL